MIFLNTARHKPANTMSSTWFKLGCKSFNLQLKGTLNGGQSFRWKLNKIGEKEQWIGVFDCKLWILEQNEDEILYKVYNSKATNVKEDSESYYQSLLRSYFQLDVDIEEYYDKWSKADPYFEKASKQFYGIRILKQEVTENIFSFICSSNNNITRITSMVEKLATYYGTKICDYEGTTYYSFPKVSDLCSQDIEKKLRENGFGYRASYISKSAKLIKELGGDEWIEKLKMMPYVEAKKTLMTLTGVGAKVADCICLMSLGHLGAIPVDTHIYQIAARLYLPKLAKTKTVTEKIYNEIGDHFRMLYGPLAGWAHTVLFCADLKKFQEESSPPNKRKKTKE